MKKYSYLTRTEQEFMEALQGADVISTEEVKALLPHHGDDMVRKVLSSLVKKGHLIRIRRGLYAASDAADLNRIALALFPGYIAFSSALKLYGLIDYEPFTIFVVTPARSSSRVVGEYTIRAVALGERATGMTLKDGIYTSTLAKTFFDCFLKPDYCGGYPGITRALSEAEGVDWKEFLGYFKRFARSSLCQRTGYILSLVKREIGTPIPGYVTDYMRGRVRTWTRLVPTLPSRGVGVGTWRLIDNLGEEHILGWSRG